MKPQQRMAQLSVVVSAVLMGSLGLFVRQVSVSDQAIALVRFSLGGVFLLAFLLVTRNMAMLRVTLSTPLVLGGVFLALAVLFYLRAIINTSLANAAFLLYLGPLLATALAALFLRERLSRVDLLLLFLAFLGGFVHSWCRHYAWCIGGAPVRSLFGLLLCRLHCRESVDSSRARNAGENLLSVPLWCAFPPSLPQVE